MAFQTKNHRILLSLLFLLLDWTTTTTTTITARAFQQQPTAFVVAKRTNQIPSTLFMSSFASDGSEYSSKDTDYEEDEWIPPGEFGRLGGEDDEDRWADAPVQELTPVPMSKNSGNRFIALVWDQDLDTKGRDSLDLHYDRDALIEDHVMFCRKRNLYNETFNTDSMVDILRSFQILASDLQRVVGHALVLESTDISHVYDMMKQEPILNGLNDGDVSNVPLYRWRHIRDYTLRIDDGRFGYPCMLVALDDDPEDVGNMREETKEDVLKYLIQSERVIAAGPLHLPTEFKDDPSSMPVGDFILFNAKNREHAIEFAEALPSAEAGLYKEMRVHFYNNLDVTGKFVSEDPLRDAPCHQMKEALEYWGYPVDDEQTPWLNW